MSLFWLSNVLIDAVLGGVCFLPQIRIDYTPAERHLTVSLFPY